MKTFRWLCLSLSLTAGSSLAAVPTSSLSLSYGPAFVGEVPADLERGQPAYNFTVDQFWYPNNTTSLRISVVENLEQTGITTAPGEICACITHYLPPRVSNLDFGLPFPASAPFEYQVNDYFYPGDIRFSVIVDYTLFAGALSTVRIGEMEIQAGEGFDTLTRFAADFRVQFVELGWVESVDPTTGLILFDARFTELPGNWLAGSLRYQSDAPAFAFLSPVPEPQTHALMLAGLGLVGWAAWRRSGG